MFDAVLKIIKIHNFCLVHRRTQMSRQNNYNVAISNKILKYPILTRNWAQVCKHLIGQTNLCLF